MIQTLLFFLISSFHKVTGTHRHFRTTWVRVQKRKHQAHSYICQLRRILKSTCLKNCWCKSTIIMY